MLKTSKNILLISFILILIFNQIAFANDELPNLNENMTEDDIEEAAMLVYAAYLKDDSTKKEANFLMEELQKLSDKDLFTYYSKNEYKNNIPIPNVILSKMDNTLDKKFKIFSLIIKNQTNLRMQLNAGITKIIAIDEDGMQHEAYTYFDTEVPEQLKKNMFSDNKIYPNAAAGFAIVFPYFEDTFKTIYIDSIIYEDNHREEIKIENLY